MRKNTPQPVRLEITIEKLVTPGAEYEGIMISGNETDAFRVLHLLLTAHSEKPKLAEGGVVRPNPARST